MHKGVVCLNRPSSTCGGKGPYLSLSAPTPSNLHVSLCLCAYPSFTPPSLYLLLTSLSVPPSLNLPLYTSLSVPLPYLSLYTSSLPPSLCLPLTFLLSSLFLSPPLLPQQLLSLAVYVPVTVQAVITTLHTTAIVASF